MHRKYKRRCSSRPTLTESQILAWADAFHERTGKWPIETSGRIAGSLGENWKAVDKNLRLGHRGLSGGSSLARLFARERGVRNVADLPSFTESLILAWADAHQCRTGQWPTSGSGPIHEAPRETWHAVNAALQQGVRSLPGGSSLARLLQSERGVHNRGNPPPLQPRQILAWADAHQRRTGKWPNKNSGPIQEAPGEGWQAVDVALYQGLRRSSNENWICGCAHAENDNRPLSKRKCVWPSDDAGSDWQGHRYLQINGIDWVVPRSGGVSTFSVPGPGKNWWLIPVGFDYPDELLVVNDHGNHYNWEPNVDLTLVDFIALLESLESAFRKVN